MADDRSKKSTTRTMPEFSFLVQIGDMQARFSEVSGLGVDANPLEYRHSDAPALSVIRMPGIKKFGNVILKKGTFKSGRRFQEWVSQVKMNAINRQPVTIQLLDESGAATTAWTLANAFPAKITGANFKAGDEVAVETLELAYEGLTVVN